MYIENSGNISSGANVPHVGIAKLNVKKCDRCLTLNVNMCVPNLSM